MLKERLLDFSLVTSPAVQKYLKEQEIQLANFNNYK
jgi:hypothetical protein